MDELVVWLRAQLDEDERITRAATPGPWEWTRGDGSPPDHIYGRTPLWRPATIIGFERPGQGARTDLKTTAPKRPTASEEKTG
jgi:hypothetical protein